MAGGLTGLAILPTSAAGLAALARGSASQQNSRANVGDGTGCELCRRESASYSKHHLVPRAQGGRNGPTAKLCSTCHRQLHVLFSEATLARELGSIHLIRANPEMSHYVKWVRRQKGLANFRVRPVQPPPVTCLGTVSSVRHESCAV